jgi:predicted amidophosphoribosyltransferase
MKRLLSETKIPGMQSNRCCSGCGALLQEWDDGRCSECRPRLSDEARAVGVARRREREEIEQAERQIVSLDHLIRRLYRRLKDANSSDRS